MCPHCLITLKLKFVHYCITVETVYIQLLYVQMRHDISYILFYQFGLCDWFPESLLLSCLRRTLT